VGEYTPPVAEDQLGVSDEGHESVRFPTPDSNPSLESRDFDAEASEQLQVKAAHESLRSSEQPSRANKISADFNEANIIHGKRTRRAAKYNDA
jgi:hypothetical protein